jgi:hypothetical protein
MMKAYQSKLTAVETEIVKLRAKRRPVPYRRIRFGIKVDPATIFRFVKVRSKGRRVYALPPLRSQQNQVDNQTRDGRCIASQPACVPCSTQRASSGAPLVDLRVPARTNQLFLKTFIPGNEYNLTRLSPEEKEVFERELDRQIELERQQKESRHRNVFSTTSYSKSQIVATWEPVFCEIRSSGSLPFLFFDCSTNFPW